MVPGAGSCPITIWSSSSQSVFTRWSIARRPASCTIVVPSPSVTKPTSGTVLVSSVLVVKVDVLVGSVVVVKVDVLVGSVVVVLVTSVSVLEVEEVAEPIGVSDVCAVADVEDGVLVS